MLRVAMIIGLSCVATAAAAQSTGSARDLRAAAFAGGAPPAPLRENVITQKVAGKTNAGVYVFAGATPAETRLRDDPRWTPANDADRASSIVNTKIGVGYRKGPMESSFGYMRRELRDAPTLYGDKPRRDSMIGVSLKFRPGA